MAEFNLERFKYNWKGNWTAETTFNRDDVVRVNGKSYVSLKTHISSDTFEQDYYAIIPGSDPEIPDPYWIVMTGGNSFVGEWITDNSYHEGDIVFYGGTLFVCITGHVSTLYEDNVANWTILSANQKFYNVWEENTGYGLGSIVRYNGNLYKCITPHTSSGTLENNSADWSNFFTGVEFKGYWTAGETYILNDYVVFGGSLFRVIETHTSTTTFDSEKFLLEIPGTSFAGEWNNTEFYATGDIIIFGGTSYYCVLSNQAKEPTTVYDEIYWIQLLESFNFKGEWSELDAYKPGDLVLRGGEVFKSLTSIGTNDINDYLDTSKWQLVIPGKRWSNNWIYNTKYKKNEVVYFLGSTWMCTNPHTASYDNFPGDSGSGYDFWDLVIQSGSDAGMDTKGDMLVYNLTRGIIGDESSFGPTNIPIGTLNQKLSINSIDDPYWRTLYTTENTVVYVSKAGIDGLNRGLDPNLPFRTIKYACEFVENNLTGHVKVNVATGQYYEILPIIIPAQTVVMGDELRSVTIEASLPNPNIDSNNILFFAMLSRLQGIMFDILTNVLIDSFVTNDSADPIQLIQNIDIEDSDQATYNFVVDLLSDIRETTLFYLQNIGEVPNVLGTNDLSESQAALNGANILRENIEFLIEDTYQYLLYQYPVIEFPNIIINEEEIKSIVNELLNALIYDIEYPGNYKSVNFGISYKNRQLGSSGSDMFYVRDETGLRNCTVKGLVGTLPDLEFGQFYRKPVGPAYVSLDPGWGPADTRTWINTRSPYMQGVTTIGTACVGAKIDGDLHNGGNRSMVANDFTQVLSDGIGAWILNNARAELVSVFTYYCAIGYLAEDGGTIRATNGNNSYGRFGSIADGLDVTEVPKTAKVDNRNQQASVNQAFAGEITDKILIFEYDHCGQDYTEADAIIIGAGNFADTTYDEFRNGSIFQGRLIEFQDSGVLGGIGYSNVGNNAQTGTATTITLASNDETEPDVYIGQRLVITSGIGTGQYGYIQAYDDTTKVATIYKDSIDEAGWDHVVPGTPIENLLATNTQYRIEPRLQVDRPVDNVELLSLPNNKLWTNSVWGTTYEIYNNVPIDIGENAGENSQAASFNIIKNEGVYEVTLQADGTGYSVGDTFVITGDIIGGVSGLHDLTIEIATVTDDSSNSILTFTSRGNANPGRWFTASEGNFGLWSDDGLNWSEFFLPLVGEWKKTVADSGYFICIPGTTSNTLLRSRDGKNWGTAALPSSSVNLIDIAIGGSTVVIIGEETNTYFYSLNGGQSWAQASLPQSTPNDGSSTSKQWQAITYGFDKFIIISGSDRAIAYSSDAITWTIVEDTLPVGDYDWAEITYGSGRIIGISRNNGTALICPEYDLSLWVTSDVRLGTLPTDILNYTTIRHGNGVFIASGNDPNNIEGKSDYIAASDDGLNWRSIPLGDAQLWYGVAYGYDTNNNSRWITVAYNSDRFVDLSTGRRALLRTNVIGTNISSIKIWDPGSGYDKNNPPNFTLYDNNVLSIADIQFRIGNNVLPQPVFANRGIGYRSSTTTVEITGNGYADIIPVGKFITVNNLDRYPGPGAQLRIDGVYDEELGENVQKIYILVTVQPLGSDGNGKFRALFRTSPFIQNTDNLQHGTDVVIREKYSQCRITGHDFLDIGTGNFVDTNYPNLYSDGEFFEIIPANEVFETNGGRVFYTSTDQDGNFRGGELFSVEQATGVVTISADFFNLDGLSELRLGGVRLGGTGTVVREFSRDPIFTEDSNNIIPTQRAITTFLANRLTEGGSEIETNDITAGLIKVGTENNIIAHTAVGFKILFPKKVNFAGNINTGIAGHMLAQAYFLRTIDSTIG